MKEINNKLTQKFDEYPTFGVLQGVKVFVTGTNIAGPFAGSLMAEMGAKVLQAEAPSIACQTRGTLAWSQNHRNEYRMIRQPSKKNNSILRDETLWRGTLTGKIIKANARICYHISERRIMKRLILQK